MSQFPSPNCDARPEGIEIDTLVLHYTGMETAVAAYERLCNPEAKVSAHFFVHENGEIEQLVDEADRAWHAGVSSWRGKHNVNDFSIGVEIVNPGHEFGYVPFPDIQMESVIQLCHDIKLRHPILKQSIIGHSDVAPDRKQDPGELFDWKRLAEAGVGIWPDLPQDIEDVILYRRGDSGNNVAKLQYGLADYGYPIQMDGQFGTQTEAVVMAFQRHFVQDRIDGVWTRRCDTLLQQLLILAVS